MDEEEDEEEEEEEEEEMRRDEWEVTAMETNRLILSVGGGLFTDRWGVVDTWENILHQEEEVEADRGDREEEEEEQLSRSASLGWGGRLVG